MKALTDHLIIGLPCNISPSLEKRDFYRGKEIHFNDSVFSDLLISFKKILPIFIPIGHSRKIAETYAPLIDGLLLTGGRDMSPSLYGEKALRRGYRGETKRPKFEMWLVEYAQKNGKPVLGICQGCQVINVAFGGSLYQDIMDQNVSRQKHLSDRQKVSNLRHKIKIRSGSILSRITGTEEMVVNSAHHQAIKRVGRGLRIAAEAGDGIVEAVERAGGPFCLGLQWHAEQMGTDKIQRKIFKAFFEACLECRKTQNKTEP